jgi:hypothetical protein
MRLKILALWLVLGGVVLTDAAAQGLWSVTPEGELGSALGSRIAKEVAQSDARNIDEILSKINRNMPSRIDGMTTLMGLRRSERTIIYEYVFNIHLSKLTLEARKDLRQKVIDGACKDRDNVNYLRRGNEFLYRYSSLHGDLLLGQRVSLQYC